MPSATVIRSVRRAQRRLRITARLIQVADANTIPGVYGFIPAGEARQRVPQAAKKAVGLDRTFAWIERGIEQRNPFMVSLNMFPSCVRVSDDSRHADMLRRVGLA